MGREKFVGGAGIQARQGGRVRREERPRGGETEVREKRQKREGAAKREGRTTEERKTAARAQGWGGQGRCQPHGRTPL